MTTTLKNSSVEGYHCKIDQERAVNDYIKVGKRDRKESPRGKSPSKVVGTSANSKTPAKASIHISTPSLEEHPE